MSTMSKNSVSRRTFLAGSTAAAVAAVTVAGGMGGTARADEAAPWDVESEVVVVGAGCAGLCAALAAQEAGAQVTVLEREAYCGGAALLSGGNARFGGGTPIQKDNGIEDTPELMYDEMMAYGNCRAVPELLRAFCDNSVDTAAWLETFGIEWDPNIRQQGGDSIPRTIVPLAEDAQRGRSLMVPLIKAAEERGIQILLEHRACDLVSDADGAVIGVEVETPEGAKRIGATKAVVIASCGFKDNEGLRRQYDNRLDGDIVSAAAPYVTHAGEMTAAALRLGAATRDMNYASEPYNIWGTPYSTFWDAGNYEAPVESAGQGFSASERVVYVANGGTRFVNEQDGNALTDAWLNLQDRPRNVWAITDGAGAEASSVDLELFAAADPAAPKHLDPAYVAVADTLDELAAKIGVPADALSQTIADYNDAAAAGVDEAFGKQDLEALGEGPYYATKLTSFVIDQMGGLAVNAQGQVIKQTATLGPDFVELGEQEVIPHLYCAGEAAGGYFGEKRGYGKMSLYMVLGRLTGQAAAQEAAR